MHTCVHNFEPSGVLCEPCCGREQGRINHVANVSIETGLPSKFEFQGPTLRLISGLKKKLKGQRLKKGRREF